MFFYREIATVKKCFWLRLQTGIAKGVSFQHFEIINDDNGAPHIKLTEKALERASTMGATSWFISIADEQRYATATVILSK